MKRYGLAAVLLVAGGSTAHAAGGKIESTTDVVSQLIVASMLVAVFALLAADRIHRVLVPITAVAVLWLLTYFTPWKLISFETAKDAVDLNVILLLAAMMMLVGVVKTTNVFP